jgi:hypothetical protein
LAEVAEKETAVVVPGVCGGFDNGAEQVGRNEDLVMLEEDTAH